MNRLLRISFTALIISFPILQQYKSPIAGIPLADFIAIAYIPSLLINFRLKKTNIWLPFIFCFLLILYAFLFIFIDSNSNYQVNLSNLLIGIVRLSFHFILIILGVNSLFNISFAIRIFKYIGIFATLYLCIQFAAYYLFGKILPWIIPFLNVYQDGYGSIDFTNFFNDFYRPYSFFLEPGFYVQFILPLLVIMLLNDKYYDMFTSVFISIGIILSTSGQGLMILPLIWGFFIFNRYRKNIWKFSVGTFLCLIFLYIFKDNSIISRSFDRLFGGENASSHLRIFQPLQMFSGLPTFNQIMGIGYNNIATVFGATYLNSFGFLLISVGVVGSTLYFLYIITLFFRLKLLASKLILIIFVILLFVSGIVTSGSTVFYFSILISLNLSQNNVRREVNNEIPI